MLVQMLENCPEISNRVLLFLFSSLTTSRLKIRKPGTAVDTTEATTSPRLAAPEP